ncbi:unnamed protein product [Phaedon cochleariae]|uniref:DUF4806 domain-containing protein n=1 Tax=Phaedon cochleariae TaxID=80249 RepID=A0A9N9SD40_PHACE|nr:unnamed protein product [Phaedon cochleariae]
MLRKGDKPLQQIVHRINSYLDARRRAKTAEYDSSDCSEDKDSRKNRKKIVMSSSEDEGEISNIADPPQRTSKIGKSSELQDKILPAANTNAKFPNTIAEVTSNNIQQQEVIARSDIVLEFDCGCCLIHNKKDIEALSVMKEDIKTIVSDNFKYLSRKQNMITTMIFDLVNEVRKISEEMKSIGNQGVFNKADTEDYTSLFKNVDLPIDCAEKMKQFEEFLSEEKYFIASIHEISRIGEGSPYEFARRVFGRLLTNEMAVQYTWLGTKEKEALVKTKLADVLLKAFEKCIASWDVKQAEDAIKKYLRRARERLGSNKKSH